MSVLASIGLVAAGFVVLVAGAEGLVRGAAGLAEKLGVSPLVIGLTVVAFGTSAPEVAVSLAATLDGKPELALGNVLGSNIFNVLFILGISALIVPLIVNAQLIRFDVPVLIAVSVGVWLMALDGSIGMFDGIVLLAGLVGYTVWTVIGAQRERKAIKEAQAPPTGRVMPVWLLIVLLVAGLAGCVFGARLLVSGAVGLALAAGVSELVIGLTIVAAGTSLPEVAASIAAAVRGQRDLAVGNVVGSNLFNLLGILGLCGVVGGTGQGVGLPVAPGVLQLDLPIMVAAAVACLPIFFTGREIRRWEGALFLALYIGYTTLLILEAQDHAFAPAWKTGLIWIVLPLTALGLGVSVFGSVRSAKRAAPAGPTEPADATD